MEILLQNKKTLNFVKATGGWTDHRDKAQVFSSGLEAMFFCLNHQIFDMQILGQFVDSRMNFTMAVTDRRDD